jgi:hypothetical protein
MTFDLRARRHEPTDSQERPSGEVTQDLFDAWYEKYDRDILEPTYDSPGWFALANAGFAALLSALQQADGVWTADVSTAALGAPAPRGPRGQVAIHKLETNEGWHVTGAESQFLAEALEAFLSSSPTLVVREVDMDAFLAAAPGSPPPTMTKRYSLSSDDADPEILGLLHRAIAFFREAQPYGFEVW